MPSTLELILAATTLSSFAFKGPQVIQGIGSACDPPPLLEISAKQLGEALTNLEEYHVIMDPADVNMLLNIHAQYKEELDTLLEDQKLSAKLKLLWSNFCSKFREGANEAFAKKVKEFHSEVFSFSDSARSSFIRSNSSQMRAFSQNAYHSYPPTHSSRPNRTPSGNTNPSPGMPAADVVIMPV
ncbi:hypothetical protein BD779DRAFT_218092 [Infundibulicybe gibba]|nr:hypothetical protein BD779DRAFT_218092 [Infundibulicybe gibba]